MFSKQETDVKVWNMWNGQISEISVNDTVLFLKKGYSPDVNPLEVATSFVDSVKTFLDIYDVEIKVTSNQKKSSPPVSKSSGVKLDRSWDRRKKGIDQGDPITRTNGIGIYHQRIYGLYQRYPETFTIEELTAYFQESYPDMTQITLINKRCAYSKYLQESGTVKIVKRIGRKKSFQFVKPIPEEEQ